jgi:beta-glucosidase-like glycosyl hydrolase
MCSRPRLGFDGFLISDWEAVYELSGRPYYDQVVQMVNAGVDMAMEPNNWQGWITTLKAAVNNGDVSMDRIDDAVRRILQVKARAGVFDEPLADRALVNSGAVGSAAHRAVAREAVRKSLVLLKNDGVLPIRQDQPGLRRRQERRQHRPPMRRLDHLLAGRQRRHHARHHDPRGIQASVERGGGIGDLQRGRLRIRRARRGHRGHR